MRRPVTEIRRFYDSPLGTAVTRLVGRKLNDAWGSTAGQDILGVGFAAPWLEPMSEARRAVCAMPEGQGAEAWPGTGGRRTLLCEDAALPFSTGLFDRVLAVHAIEEAADPLAMVREMGRVLAPSGRLVLVVAGRGGLWARAENTPFGHGRPYTRGQLEQLIREAELEPLAWSHAVHAPPWPALAGWADTLESIGGRLVPGAGGVVMLEAVKTAYAVHPRGTPAAARVRTQPGLTPQPAGLSPPEPVRLALPPERD